MANYAQVILPLPIYGSFTYQIPPDYSGSLSVGSRVLVPFGRRNLYTGIVERLSDTAGVDYDIKPIAAILDADPIVRYPQLKFWNWIADYYLCTPGEVMKAALPAGLKVESETFITINKDFEETLTDEQLAAAPDTSSCIALTTSKLTEPQAILLQHIDHEGKVKIGDLDTLEGVKNPRRLVKQLLDSGRLVICEKVVDKYVARKITLVSLTCSRSDSEQLHAFFSLVARARKQEQLLLAYLELSGWMNAKSPLAPVEKSVLMAKAEATPAVFTAMVQKGIFKVERKSINRFADCGSSGKEIELPTLSPLQAQARKEIDQCWQQAIARPVLLRGVTGSGKTEIYAHLIADALQAGGQVLFLVPEISLTTQLTSRLRAIFNDKLLVYHSKFSDSERVDIWRRLLTTSEPLLVLGVRSSVFLPFSSLKLIIVDEEHESSYKQYDPAPRYNARDAATVLAQMHGARTLLGSATPSIETYYKALNGKFGLVELLSRYEDVELPAVEVVDMRRARKEKQTKGIYSLRLIEKMHHTLDTDHKQAIVFQNRRGYAPVVVCSQCGWTPKCVNCDVSMVYHRHINEIRCHYCGHSATLPSVCPACGLNSIEVHGYGTERIADDLQALFPSAALSRMDLDTTRNKDSYQEIIEEFSRRRTNILVGTQMVSKGLDFENVSLVGIINADTILNFPDFRSDERAFNMLEQVAGRAGRKGPRGTVLIQTTTPDNEVIDFVRRHDYLGFYAHELEERRTYSYPPFTKVISIYLRHKDQGTAARLAGSYALALRNIFGSRVLGPQRPLVGRISTYYLQSIMLKIEAGASMTKVKELLRGVYVSLAALPGMRSALIHYDVDPV